MICPFCNNPLSSISNCGHCSQAYYPDVDRVQIYSRFRDIFLAKHCIALDMDLRRTIVENRAQHKVILIVNELLPITPANAKNWCDKLLKLKAFT